MTMPETIDFTDTSWFKKSVMVPCDLRSMGRNRAVAVL